MTVQCCVCKRVKAEGPAPWHPAPTDRPVGPVVSHSYCPSCLRASLSAMQLELAQADLAHPLAASA
jgi:hypothetical protein